MGYTLSFPPSPPSYLHSSPPHLPLYLTFIFPSLSFHVMSDVTHSKMRRRIENPRILLLDCPLGTYVIMHTSSLICYHTYLIRHMSSHIRHHTHVITWTSLLYVITYASSRITLYFDFPSLPPPYSHLRILCSFSPSISSHSHRIQERRIDH